MSPSAQPPRGVTAAWVLTRTLVVLLWAGPHLVWVFSDVVYYYWSLEDVAGDGLRNVLVEYPVPALGVLVVPWLPVHLAAPAGSEEMYFSLLFVVLLLALDALFTRSLVRAAANPRGVWVWLLGVPLLGAVTYARFDLLPGVLVGWALLWLGRRPQTAAALAALAAAVKFWPAVVLPTLAAPRRSRRAVLTTVVAVGGGLALVSLALAGWSRLVSPLTWQGERGLQVESLPATLLMPLWSLGDAAYDVAPSRFNALEVAGPGAETLVALSTALTLAGLVAVAVLSARAWRCGDRLTPEAIGWLALAAISLAITSSRVLSPQYLLWLLPAAAVALAMTPAGPGERRLARWTTLLLVATALTQAVYPIGYDAILDRTAWSPVVVALLAARNALLVVLTVAAVRNAWRATRPIPVSAPDRSAEAAAVA